MWEQAASEDSPRHTQTGGLKAACAEAALTAAHHCHAPFPEAHRHMPNDHLTHTVTSCIYADTSASTLIVHAPAHPAAAAAPSALPG